LTAAGLTILFILFLAIEEPLSQTVYESSYNKIIKLNASQINKTQDEFLKLAEDTATRNKEGFSDFIKVYLGFFTVSILFIFISYLMYKLNRHFRMEEAVNKNTLNELLNQLEVKRKHIYFYEAIEEKYGDSTDEETYNSLATFIYNTIQSKKGRKLF